MNEAQNPHSTILGRLEGICSSLSCLWLFQLDEIGYLTVCLNEQLIRARSENIRVSNKSWTIEYHGLDLSTTATLHNHVARVHRNWGEVTRNREKLGVLCRLFFSYRESNEEMTSPVFRFNHASLHSYSRPKTATYTLQLRSDYTIIQGLGRKFSSNQHHNNTRK